MSYKSCTCDNCVNGCKSRPCWGTPGDIKKIISAGFEKQLMLDYWSDINAAVVSNIKNMPFDDILNDMVDSIIRNEVDIIAPAIKGYEYEKAPFLPIGECTFLENDRCILHSLGLKPLEGKIAICKPNSDNNYDHPYVAKLWDNDDAKFLIEEWKNKGKYYE